MKLFYGIINEKHAILTEDESHHVSKVMRMQLDDSIFVTNGKGKLIDGTISKLGKKVEVLISKEIQQKSNHFFNIHLIIAPTKNIDRFEFFIEKATELGISEITPIITANSERKQLNQEKLEKQLISASKQCLRSVFPKLNPLIKLSNLVPKLNSETTYFAHCNESFSRIPLTEISTSSKELTFLIGPEGDFSLQEIQLLNEKKIKSISLGNNRLRTETAGICLMNYFYLKSF